MKEIFYDLLGICCIAFLCWFYYHLGTLRAVGLAHEIEQTSLCYDTKKYEAWVSSKDGILRCFMEQRSFPHRVRASHIESYE